MIWSNRWHVHVVKSKDCHGILPLLEVAVLDALRGKGSAAALAITHNDAFLAAQHKHRPELLLRNSFAATIDRLFASLVRDRPRHASS